jgi:CBS domain containing-hemolysin-like protein
MGQGSALTEILLFLVCLVASAMFSAGETSFTLLDKSRMRVQAKAGNQRARLMASLWRKPERFFTPLLLGNNLANITASVAITSLFLSWWGSSGTVIAMVVVTILTLYAGELIPKGLAARFPGHTSRLLFYPLLIFFLLFWPVSFLINGFLAFFRRLFPLFGRSDSYTSRRELETLAHAYGASEREMLGNALRFSDLTLAEVMVPRVEMRSFPETKPVAEVLEECRGLRYSRFPLYTENPDQMTGVLFLKDLLGISPPVSAQAKEYARPVTFLVESLPIAQAIEQMRSVQTSIVLVLDERGGVAGLVTLEDLTEEIVGEIWDEFEQPRVLVVPGEEGEWVLDARIPLRELAQRWQVFLPVHANTLGGALEELSGEIPLAGQRFPIPNGELVVLNATVRSVRRVGLRLAKPV